MFRVSGLNLLRALRNLEDIPAEMPRVYGSGVEGFMRLIRGGGSSPAPQLGHAPLGESVQPLFVV